MQHKLLEHTCVPLLSIPMHVVCFFKSLFLGYIYNKYIFSIMLSSRHSWTHLSKHIVDKRKFP